MTDVEHCPECGQPLDAATAQDERARINARFAGVKSGQLVACRQQLEGAVRGFEAIWTCPHGHRFAYPDAGSPKWCPGCGTSTLTRTGGQSRDSDAPKET